MFAARDLLTQTADLIPCFPALLLCTTYVLNTRFISECLHIHRFTYCAHAASMYSICKIKKQKKPLMLQPNTLTDNGNFKYFQFLLASP